MAQKAYRGTISGLTLSGDVSNALPSELAYLNDPDLENLFALKFAEKKLLSYAYENRVLKTRELHKTEEVKVSVSEKEKKGPIILCVDTSGSMSGTPEHIAKALALSMSLTAIDENRKCFLISFSTDIEVKDLTETKKGNSLKELISFLRMSFYGGTDATPALEKSLEMLKQENWGNADVLMISDFCMGDFNATLTKKIDEQKAKKTKFYSLAIGTSGNTSTIKSFNENWSYDTLSQGSMRRLVRDMHDKKIM